MSKRVGKYLAVVILAMFLGNSLDSYISYANSADPITQSSNQEDQECDDFETEAVLTRIQLVSVKYFTPMRRNSGEKHEWFPERFELPELEPPSTSRTI